MPAKVGGNLNPETYTEGGLIDNVDVKWLDAVVQKGYKDESYSEATVAKVTMELESGEPHEEYYSMGGQCEPNDDGTGIEGGGSIGRSTKFSKLIKSIIDAGFPQTKIKNDLSIFTGLHCHMVRQVVEKRQGLARPARADGKVFDETVLLVDSIISMPGEKKGKTAPKPESESEDLTEKATGEVMAVLAENPKGMTKEKLASAVFARLKTDPDRNKIAQMIYKDSFFAEGAWTVEKGIIKM